MPSLDTNGRVLIVEDDRVLCGLYRTALELGGLSVDWAADGLRALERIEAARPDLIILDIDIPIIDGWELLARLRRVPGAPPVVVISGLTDLTPAKRLGAVACFAKPFPLAQLRDTCTEILREPAPAAAGPLPQLSLAGSI